MNKKKRKFADADAFRIKPTAIVTPSVTIPLYTYECKMCGCDRVLNDKGYCSRCWYIWTH